VNVKSDLTIPKPAKESTGIAKSLTLWMLTLAFLTGVVGAFVPSFNMAGYTTFLKGFAPLYISLIASIGANSAVKKYKES